MLGIKKLLNKLRKNSKKLWVSGSYGIEPNMPMQMESRINTPIVTDTTNTFVTYDSKRVEYKDERIEKKPIDVVNEILSEMPKINITDLKGQIKVVETRLKTLKKLKANIYNEETALVYLRARLKLPKYINQFNWKTTNSTLIQELCKKYKVQMVGFGGYARNVPAEAIEEIEKYIKAWELVVKDYEPVFELIIDSGGKEQKKDPILLAKSPFGNWYYVLGAWDKEVEIIDDIIYNGK